MVNSTPLVTIVNDYIGFCTIRIWLFIYTYVGERKCVYHRMISETKNDVSDKNEVSYIEYVVRYNYTETS